MLEALNKLKELGSVLFLNRKVLDTADTESALIISIIESIAQAENESRSVKILDGAINVHAAQGTSKLYNRKCYGYENDEDGLLMIKNEEANNVWLIFDLYLHEFSIIGIKRELEKRGIITPTEKEKWSQRTIDTMLSNKNILV